MKTFEVKIQAVVTKTLEIEAKDEGTAIELAHVQFTTQPEIGVNENYDEDCVSCLEVVG